ncbi:hypothetical protein ACLB2K_059366 [Fragaria x ananassa]
MEMHTIPNGAADFDNLKRSVVESSVSETAILADKSLLFLLLLVWSSTNKNNILPNSVRTDRFPTSDLNKVKEPDAENNDAGEAKDDKDSDDDDEDKDNDEDDGNDSEEDSDDDEEDSDDELEAAGYGESDDDEDEDDEDDDSDEDEDDDSDDDEDDDDSEDEDEDDEEQFKLPSQRKK